MSIQWKRQKDYSNIVNIVLCIWFRCMNILYSYPDGVQSAFGKSWMYESQAMDLNVMVVKGISILFPES